LCDIISQEDTTNGLGKKLVSVMHGKMHKTYTPKDVKICIGRIVMIKPSNIELQNPKLGKGVYL
jgi:hypothetical protein